MSKEPQKIIGELTRAGTFVVGDSMETGLFISMSRGDIQKINRLPMYRAVEVVECVARDQVET